MTTTSSQTQRIILLSVGALILLTGGIAAGYFFLPTLTGRGEVAGEQKHDEENIWYCPMHPQIQQEGPGICPICHMDLVPKKPSTASSDQAGMKGDRNDIVQVTPRERVVADVATAEVDYRQINASIVASAQVEVNEETQKVVTAWYPGRIERLFVKKTGEYVRKGDPLAEVYSPELTAAQKEYLVALDTKDRHLLPSIDRTGGDGGGKGERGDQLVNASRQRLKLMGMSDAQIESLEKRGEITWSTTIFSTASGIVTKRAITEGAYVNEGTLLLEVIDLSSIWVVANIYEGDAGRIVPGMRMVVTGPSLSGERIEGRVEYIYPSIDPTSRTLRVRGIFSNPGLRLKPGMYLTATVMNPARDVLAVPAGAVIRTGARDLVYVEVKENTFEARNVTLGLKGEGYYQIVEGDLKRGDKVVAEGGYLLDSERELEGGK